MKKRVTTRMNKLRRKQIKYSLISLIKSLLKNVYYLLIGIAYVILKAYVELEKGLIKIWKIFPIWVKRIIIIVMLININILNDKPAEIIEKIQSKYAPINANNDPTGLNNNWVSGVTYFYNQL